MHPKNPFSENYDFDRLINDYPPLKQFVFVNDYGTKTIKFGDKNAVKALNAALLKSHYGIDWNIPEDNLCPPIPGRLDYLLHISDLLQKPTIRLLDIGTGSNLIYPILASCHFNWKCVGSEVNTNSLKNAHELISTNKKLATIELRQQKFKHSILENIIQEDDFFDVVICNPPFYKSAEDAQQKNARKVAKLKLNEHKPLNFGGRSNELWFKGGEEAFVKKMVQESEQFKMQVNWFTSLISQKEHLNTIKRAINKLSVAEIKVIEMTQGNKISRFIAWRF